MLILKPGISYHKSKHAWFLSTKSTTYVIGVDMNTGLVLNLYWGSRLVTFTDIDLDNKIEPERSSQDPAITSATEEFPVFGGLRYGPDLLRIQFENGTRELDLVYDKGELNDENTELVITLQDKVHIGCRIHVKYALDIENDLILRTATIHVSQGESLCLTKAHTAAWHIPPPANSCRRELITLAGAWAAETQVQTHSLEPGTSHILQSTRGIPSAQAYPYFAVKDQVSDGEHSDCEVYFGSLGWSGNWAIELHTDIRGKVTITGGMNDRDFGHRLEATDTFELPEFVAGFTTEGLSGARRCLTSHIRDNKDKSLVKAFQKVAPILYNGWEAYGFGVTFENQKEMAEKAARLGAELFVLDDGWFHQRNSDKAGLGDWFPDSIKFPNGLKPLADHVHGLGMLFGLWFEPEMVNPDSNLYREHPDWVYHYPERTRHLERNQLVLNITKPEVQDYLLERMISTVTAVGVDYIKWDMNRPISEAGSDLGKAVWTEHVHAFNQLIAKVKEFTGLIRIETCCSGGGRADLSILKRTESCWPSDNTRPDARIRIQYGASFIMPSNSMSCWVTDSPNNDMYTHIPISYRFHVSFMGALGIGSNLNGLSQSDSQAYTGWIALYKELRSILQLGNLDWLVVPSSKPSAYTAVTQTSTATGNAAVVLAFRQDSPFWLPLGPVRLRGLIGFALYHVRIWSRDPTRPEFTGTMSGSALMNRGLNLPYLTSKAYSSVVVHLAQKA